MLRLVIEVSESIPDSELEAGDTVVVRFDEETGELGVAFQRELPVAVIRSLLHLADSPKLRILSASLPALLPYLRALSQAIEDPLEPSSHLRVLK